MTHPDYSTPQPGLPRFVRIASMVWLGLIIIVLLGTLLAPYMGRLIDFGLHHTSHRAWTAMRLSAGEMFFDLSTPILSVRSYYSALYRGDAVHMERLSDGVFRQLMQQRLAHRASTFQPTLYRSYTYLEDQDDARAVVIEKFHLFWGQGLRFYLERTDFDWRIVQLALLP
jgi:hypothetical protein